MNVCSIFLSKMILFKYIIVFILLFIVNSAYGQVKDPIKIYPVKPLEKVEAKDVMWHRRLWREIDLTEKINQHLYFGDSKTNRNYCLYDILNKYIQSGAIKVYSATTDDFTKELTISETNNKTGDSVFVEGKLIYKQLDSKDVVKYWLKEDWFFDTKYSKIEVRITGICPVKVKKDKNGNILGYEQLFWLYFPNVRGALVNYDAFQKQEDESRISFDDVLTYNRMFNSYIVVKSGNKLRELKQNKTELDVKLENEKTKIYHFNKQNQLWIN